MVNGRTVMMTKQVVERVITVGKHALKEIAISVLEDTKKGYSSEEVKLAHVDRIYGQKY